MVRSRRLRAGIVAALLVGAACAVFLWEPWHGPIVLSLSTSHGIDAGDLPGLALLALAVVAARAWAHGPGAEPRGSAGGWGGPLSAVVLGLLLLVGLLLPAPQPPALLPAGGGTFAGDTRHADGQRPDPVDQWSHIAVTFDGTILTLYVDGDRVSSRETPGAILSTTDPLWIGGNHPYGEYFHGLIDEVRVYDRALDPAEVRAEMSTPIGDGPASPASGLVAAYAFDERSGELAADSSGAGNIGALFGPTWTRGRFGDALRFDGSGALVRVPAAPSLDLSGAMTLSAWIRPDESQAGWRTIVHRQRDAYFLMAGGGGETGPTPLDDARVALLVGAAVWLCVALAGGRSRSVDAGRSWWAPVALFLVGSAIDVSLAAPGTVIGPTLVAIWFALTARRRAVAASMFVVAVVLTGVTVVALSGRYVVELARDDGGFARSAALGLVLVTAGILAARYGSRAAEQQASP